MKNRGITLIALVVTIVVLLILAAVSINTLGGENGIIRQAQKAKEQEEIAGETEQLELIISNTKAKKLQEKDNSYLKKAEIKENLTNDIDGKATSITDRRPGEEYVYIVNIGEREYGIRENNTVQYLEPGIRNQYIEILKVTEVTPAFRFENTITQKMINGETGKKNSTYEILGVSGEIDGTYITSGTIDGKTGTFSIIDLDNTTIEYKLTNFLQEDEQIYLKVLIDGSIEKIQTLNIIQGDIVQYEENFAGITYTGTWTEVEDENCSEGKAVYSSNKNDFYEFAFFGTSLNYSVVAKEDAGRCTTRLYSVEEDGTETLKGLVAIQWTNTGIVTQYPNLIDLKGSRQKCYGKTKYKNTISSNNLKIYLDSIWIYRYE